MNGICKQCGAQFEISDSDLKFYEKVSPVINGKKFLISPPTLCPEDRFRRRILWRNERGLYRRKCDKTGDTIISWISPDKPHKVYKKSEWWGDNWDARDYGRDFDFNRPFFDQLEELLKEVPWIDLLVDNTVNSDYTNFCNNLKNCYLVYASNNDQDSMYSSYIWGSNDCIDCLQLFDCQLCYECVDLTNCYGCKFSRNCSNCSDNSFCYGCQNCQNCAFCVNLVGKKHCFFNEQLSEADYKKRLAEVDTGSYSAVCEAKQLFDEHKKKFPVRFAKILNSENCTGDEIKNCKNTDEAFDSSGAEDCKWLWLCSDPVKDCYDVSGTEQAELCYDTVCVGIPATRVLFSAYVWKGINEVLYSVLSPGSKNCFGIMGLKFGKYCILNKQYTKEEYEKMLVRIIEHMKKTGEWGEFFPAKLAPFGYNETLAQDYFPLKKDEALKAGFNWSDYEHPTLQFDKVIKAAQVPDNISDVNDNITSSVVECEVSGKYFKILPQELKFYKMNKLPLPRRHPDQRHMDRLVLRNPRKLWKRKCDKCGLSIKTTYPPYSINGHSASLRVCCEKCYLGEVY